MFEYLIDLFRELSKKGGCKFSQEDIDDVAEKPIGLFGGDTLPKYVDNKNLASRDQGRQKRTYMACTSYCANAMIEHQNIKSYRNSMIFGDPKQQWENQLSYGTASLVSGDYLHEALNIAMEYPLEYKNVPGEVIRPTEWKTIPKDLWRDKLASGELIMTGLGMGSPSIYPDYTWRAQDTSQLAHCIVVVGYDDDRKAYIAFNTSWGKWGEDNNGRFYIPYKDVDLLFRGYILKF